MSIDTDLTRLADASENIAASLELIARVLDKQAVTSIGALELEATEIADAPAPVSRRRITDRVEWWKATHPTWAADPLPSQAEIRDATGIRSTDSVDKIRKLLVEHQEAVRRCLEQ